METQEEKVLNVTLLEPRKKHPAIFAQFDKLEEGEAFIILNDHDPKPLYYQFMGERGNTFTWEYLADGPEWWQVRIGKRRAGEKDMQLNEIAESDKRKAEVFKKYQLDFSCSGSKTLKETCADLGVDVVAVEKELNQLDKVDFSLPEPFQKLHPDAIVPLDVRSTLASGVDPLQLILEKVKSLQPGQVLKLINTFEPAPLLKLLGKQGFLSLVTHPEPGLVYTWFYKENTTINSYETAKESATEWDKAMGQFEGKMETLDVRHLEMPGPMHTILDTLGSLPDGNALFVIHKKLPVFLLPELSGLGYEFRTREIGPGELHLLIFKRK